MDNLPVIKFNGNIIYETTFIGCATSSDKLLNLVNSCRDETIVMGFDLEWPFTYQTGSGKTALMQISPNLDECYVFHLYEMKALPVVLVQLLEHPKCRWTGVNIKNDFRKLACDFPGINGDLIINNCIEASTLANKVLSRSRRWSMKDLVAEILKVQISKDNKVRKSKWNLLPLSDEQILYAATDAYVSLKLYYSLKEMEINNPPY